MRKTRETSGNQIRPLGGLGARRTFNEGRVIELASSLAAMQVAVAADARRHRRELRTMSQAYAKLYAEHVEVQAAADQAMAVLRERCFHLEKAMTAGEAREAKLQTERDAFSRALRAAREENCVLTGRVQVLSGATSAPRAKNPPLRERKPSPSAPLSAARKRM